MRIIHLISDTDGCHTMRVRMPFNELKRFEVESDEYCFLPSEPGQDQFNLLINILKGFDLCIIQRCYLYNIAHIVKKACEFLGLALVYEVDDDYENLIRSNPAYFALADDQSLFKRYYSLQMACMEARQAGKKEESDNFLKQAQDLLPDLEASRQRGLEGYRAILRMVDWVQVSTEELKQVVYPHNKNVVVFENNIERVFWFRDNLPLKNCLVPTGEKDQYRIEIPNTLGLYTIPGFDAMNDGSIRKIPRIGYTATPSHAGEDWESIREGLNRFHNANIGNHSIVLFENEFNPYFFNSIENKQYTFIIKPCQYEKYLFNIRNFDIALCPLFPSVFNMSKSDIKLVEAAAWGVPGLAPRFITYSRNFIDEETCLMYSNQDEFVDQLERLVKDHALRERLGQNAREYVASQRLEKFHSEKRYNFYKSVIESKSRLKFFKPNKEQVNG